MDTTFVTAIQHDAVPHRLLHHGSRLLLLQRRCNLQDVVERLIAIALLGHRGHALWIHLSTVVADGRVDEPHVGVEVTVRLKSLRHHDNGTDLSGDRHLPVCLAESPPLGNGGRWGCNGSRRRHGYLPIAVRNSALVGHFHEVVQINDRNVRIITNYS